MTAMRQQPWLILAVTIAAPVMEEIVFRGAIFGGLSGTINPLWAALISSLLFSLLHQDGHLIIYAAIGLFLCWLYRKTGSLYTTIISHAGMNLLVTLTYLLR
jgi:membrane protease YdiL (CAAX protease family)